MENCFIQVVVEDFNRPDAAAEGSTLGAWFYSDKAESTKVSQFKENDSNKASE